MSYLSVAHLEKSFGSTRVLRDVSFVIEPGQTVAFVGATGAGKSSILNLIGRYYDIQKGKITIDGIDIRELDIHALRRAVGQVQQDVFLFTGDIQSNIRLRESSITDGQIFLESALFNAGNRPAVNVGLSVSRVGGAAQTKAMKKANANLRIELAQYKDMESFAQFSSDLDAETRRQLDHGKALMEMLKQPLYQPKSDAEQVVLLTLASHGVLDEIPTAELRTKTSAFVRQFRADVSGTMDKITATGKLEPDEVDAILNAWKAYAGGDSHAVQ